MRFNRRIEENISLLVFVKELRDEVNVAVELSNGEHHVKEYQGEPFQDGMHHEIFDFLTKSAFCWPVNVVSVSVLRISQYV